MRARHRARTRGCDGGSASPSSRRRSPYFLQYLPLHSQHSQMPSPAEPRFCLITRGWKAHVFLKPEISSSSL